MGQIAILAGGTVVGQPIPNGRKVRLPDGRTMSGPVALPCQNGAYRIVAYAAIRGGTDAYHRQFLDPNLRSISDDAMTDYWVEEFRPVDEILAEKLRELAAYRYGLEQGGIAVGGRSIATDDRSKALINGAYMRALDGEPTATRDFKSADGWIDITNAEVVAIGEALADWVQALFTQERVHDEAMRALADTATPEEMAAYDFTTGWPDTGA